MANILIRQAGPYTVESDGSNILVNGRPTTFSFAPPKSGFAYVVDTGCKGANGKQDFVGISSEQYAAYRSARDADDQARKAEARAADRAANPEYFATRDALEAKAKTHDALYNEGREGYNPYNEQLRALDRANGRLVG